MIDLKCKLTNCQFNKNCNCTAKEISVDKSAQCKSFSPTKSKQDQPDELSMPLFHSNTCVNCKANCLFAKNKQCIANGITVCDETGQKQAADCSTYMPK